MVRKFLYFLVYRIIKNFFFAFFNVLCLNNDLFKNYYSFFNRFNKERPTAECFWHEVLQPCIILFHLQCILSDILHDMTLNILLLFLSYYRNYSLLLVYICGVAEITILIFLNKYFKQFFFLVNNLGRINKLIEDDDFNICIICCFFDFGEKVYNLI